MTKDGCHPVWVSAEEEQRNHDQAHAEVRRNAASCEAGDPFACGLAASAYKEGRGVAADVRKAAVLQQRALAGYRARCEHEDAVACSILASAYELGDGVATDSTQATRLYRRARDLDESRCQNEDAEACRRLGDLVGMWSPVRDYDRRAPLYRKALTLFDRDCKRGTRAACASAASMRQFDASLPNP